MRRIAGLAVALLMAGCDGQPAEPVIEARFAESMAAFPSAGRGFLRFVPIVGAGDLGWVRDQGQTLIYSPIRLDPTIDALPPGLADALDAGFERARQAGLMVIARAVYNDGPGDDGLAADAPIERVRGHIARLAPIYQRNADVLRAVQAGFIGAWGEWHASASGLDADPAARQAVVTDLVAALPETVPVLVRTPQFKIDAVGDGPMATRVGHHNDCFLSSDTDVGTYPAGELERWLQWLEIDTRGTTFGGETCARHPRNRCAAAIAEMERLHTVFLSRDWHPDVIERWQQDDCFEEIERRLGYRFVLDSARWTALARPGETLWLSLDLRNVGFAPPRLDWRVTVRLVGPGVIEQLTELDPRRWMPGAHPVTASVGLPGDVAPGRYAIELVVDRPGGQHMRWASAGLWRDDGAHRIGSMTIE